jgi:membrane associated rhomboid family serine protease
MDNPQSPPAALPPEAVELLHAATPRVWVTPAIAGILVACFVGSIALGADAFSPTTEQLLRLGASFGPLIAEGEWWRLITASLLHGGLLHLAFNLWALWSAGFLTERLFGNAAFLTIYLLSALGGTLASVALKPLVVGVGASGAIFGVYGALLAFMLTHRGVLPKAFLLQQRSSLFGFLLYNLAFALTNRQIDLSAHLGGLLTGMAAGWLLQRDLAHPAEHRARRAARAAALAVALLVAAWGLRERLLRTPAVEIALLLERAQAASVAHDDQKALELSTQALAIQPDAEAFSLRGFTLLRLSRPEEALADLRNSRKLEDSPSTQVYLCYASAATSEEDPGRIDAAIGECSKAIERSEEKTPLLVRRAWLLAKQRKNDEALADLARALTSSPNDPHVLGARVAILSALGRRDEAERDCAVLDKVAQPDPASHDLCATMRRLRREQKTSCVPPTCRFP